ncbi:hypothetical protein BKA62DRAFT_719465 [Auriculariales sp. MPI-PUGE-AT-0066]|nr:hypothetical protein BKA62DRAFT_719465 [Auriculariales sp. MPI-PUGE-AT-0066]
MFHLLERRATGDVLKSPMTQWRLTGNWGMDTHSLVLKKMEKVLSAGDYLRDATLNVLCQRPTTGQNATSTWRLYMSMTDSSDYWDASEGAGFAIELALLSRVGLDGAQTANLLHELTGDDRGVQLMLGDTYYFAQLATHIKAVDSTWWGSMKRCILNLSSERWGLRNNRHSHSSRDQLISEIERAPPCDMCNRTERELHRILAAQNPAPHLAVSPPM